MTISMNTIPSGTLVPLFYAEMDSSAANTTQDSGPALLIGYANADATIEKESLILMPSKDYARQICGPGTRFGPGQAIVTPSVIKGELLATYRQLERAGIVENYELFKKYLIVERDANDPNRLNTLFPPDYVNQLRVFAVVNQFRLQYPEESA